MPGRADRKRVEEVFEWIIQFYFSSTLLPVPLCSPYPHFPAKAIESPPDSLSSIEETQMFVAAVWHGPRTISLQLKWISIISHSLFFHYSPNP